MAHIANTAFEARITNGRFEDLANIAGKYQESATDVICSAGMLCTRASLMDCEGFTGVKNENTWVMNAATASATGADVIYACNTHDVNLVTDSVSGGVYAIGTNTLGLPLPAGRIGTFTRIEFDGESVYRFGAGNIDGSISTNTFFSIKDGLLKPEATAPNGKPYFSLRGTGKFIEGTTESITYYDVVAMKPLYAAAS